MRFRKLFSVFVVLLFPMLSIAQEEILQSAQEAFKKEDYGTAISLYNQLLEDGKTSVDLHFNLANAYYHQDELAYAVCHYLKVLQLDERNSAAITNLQIVNDQRASDIIAIPDFFLLQWWHSITSLFSSNLWVIFFFVVLGVGLYYFRMWLINKTRRKRSLLLVVISLFFALLFVLAAWSKSIRETKSQFLVNKEAVTLYVGPDERSGEVVKIIAGEKLKILDKREGWYKVSLVNKEVAWIKESQILKV